MIRGRFQRDPFAPRLRPVCRRPSGIFGTMRALCAGVGFLSLMSIPYREMQRFRSLASRFGQLAQLVRALRSHRRGHRFESCAAH
jgi:hypothetical protein